MVFGDVDYPVDAKVKFAFHKAAVLFDKETGKMCTVASAALLDGNGAKLGDGDDPYNFRFQAYARATIPSWCYSEPTLVEEGLT